MLVKKILQITNGRLLSGSIVSDIDLTAISTDSRTIRRGEFFLPLKGNNFDGEKFIEDAFRKGAAGAFVTTPQGHESQDKIVIKVKNTTEALQKIAHAHRMKFDIPVIGVTGSNGKTTAKEMIAKVLSSKFNVLKSEGTKNNHIGVPQTLLKLDKRHDMCVLEMGTNHKGEIRLLADIARPDVTVITNIGPSHLEFLKDLKGVFESKKEIFEFLDRDGTAIINGDDEWLAKVKRKTFRIMRFGFNAGNDFRASRMSAEGGSIKFFLNDKSQFVLNLLGAHNIYNALAAVAVAHNFGLGSNAIKKELAAYTPTCMRLNVKNLSGVMVIDDAYNSNPSSMECALQSVKDYPARAKWIVSADMLELGSRGKDFHSIIGESVVKMGFDGLLTFGSLSKHTSSRALECGMEKGRVWHCSTREEVADILRRHARQGDCILVKGSRAMKMEKVIENLKGSGFRG